MTTWRGPSPEDTRRINEALAAGIEGMKIGGHFYPRAPRRTSNCQNGCGAWMGPSRSGAPDDIDQFGACPMAPGPI
jgi:hypothetical protein